MTRLQPTSRCSGVLSLVGMLVRVRRCYATSSSRSIIKKENSPLLRVSVHCWRGEKNIQSLTSIRSSWTQWESWLRREKNIFCCEEFWNVLSITTRQRKILNKIIEKANRKSSINYVMSCWIKLKTLEFCCQTTSSHKSCWRSFQSTDNVQRRFLCLLSRQTKTGFKTSQTKKFSRRSESEWGQRKTACGLKSKKRKVSESHVCWLSILFVGGLKETKVIDNSSVF